MPIERNSHRETRSYASPDCRRERRFSTDMQARIWGMNIHGRAFSQTVDLRDISRRGALVGGLAHEISVNEIVGLLFKGKKARCCVVWRRKTSDGIRVRLLLVSGQDCPWESELADLAAKADPVRARIAREERRKYARHRLSIPLELREPHSVAPIRTSSAWISPNGCYVETILSVAVGGKLKISLWIESEKINCECIVKARDPNFGVVIEFTGLDENSKEHLRELIEKAISKPIARAKSAI